MLTREWRTNIKLIVVAIAYFLFAQVGFLWAIDGTSATPIWPPAGLAVAATLAFGKKVWPGIFIGAFFANFMHFIDSGLLSPAGALVGSSCVALGNLFEAVLICSACERVLNTRRPFDDVTHIFRFVLITVCGSLLAGFIGSSTMVLLGLTEATNLLTILLTWGLGDALAIIMLAPFLLAFWPLPVFKRQYRWLEAATAFALLALVCILVFTDRFSPSAFTSRPGLVIPVFLWLSLRFSQREVLTAVAIASMSALYATANHTGPFISTSQTNSFLATQLFSALIALTMLALSAAHSKAYKYQNTLKDINRELEKRVAERTKELERKTRALEAINNQLRIEARERLAMETKLRDLQQG